MPSLNVIFNGNANPLAREIRRVEGMTVGLIGSIRNTIIGFIGIGAAGEAFRKTIDAADELVTTSKRLSVGIENLQVLRQAAKDNSVEFTNLASAFEKLNLARNKALGGGLGASRILQSFKTLGISVDDLKTKTAAQIFQTQLAGTVKLANPEVIAGPLKDILGRAFGSLIPVLKTDFSELEKKMRSMGDIMDATTAVELKAFKDELGILSNVIIARLAPAIVSLVEVIARSIGKLQGTGSFWGTVFERMRQATPDNVPKDVLAGTGPDGKPRINFWKELWHEITNNDANSALAAFQGVDAEWQSKIDKIKKEFSDVAKDLNNPKPPEFKNLIDANKSEKQKLKDLHGDLTENQKAGAYAIPGAVTLVDITKSMDKKLGGLLSGVLEIRDEMKNNSDDDESF